jgi:hypothetical protein
VRISGTVFCNTSMIWAVYCSDSITDGLQRRHEADQGEHGDYFMVTSLENKICFVKINVFCRFLFMLTGMLFGLFWLGQMDNWARRTTSACSFLVSSFNFCYDRFLVPLSSLMFFRIEISQV